MDNETYTLQAEVNVLALLDLRPVNDNFMPPLHLSEERRYDIFINWLRDEVARET